MDMHEEAIRDCDLAIEYLNSLLFPVAIRTQEDITPGEMQNTQQSALYYKLYLRKADSCMKQENYEQGKSDSFLIEF